MEKSECCESKVVIEKRIKASKPFMIPDRNGQIVYPFSDQKGAKILRNEAAHTYIAKLI